MFSIDFFTTLSYYLGSAPHTIQSENHKIPCFSGHIITKFHAFSRQKSQNPENGIRKIRGYNESCATEDDKLPHTDAALRARVTDFWIKYLSHGLSFLSEKERENCRNTRDNGRNTRET